MIDSAGAASPPASSGHPFTIHWKLWLKVANQRAADKVLRRFADALGQDVRVAGGERYWKDLTLYIIWGTTPLGTDDVKTAVFETLAPVGRVSWGCSVKSPESYGDHWTLGGIATPPGMRAVGVEMIEFETRNYDLPVVVDDT